nr:MAG TPA: hypothetical protein [Caudoviricetes sp.]
MFALIIYRFWLSINLAIAVSTNLLIGIMLCFEYSFNFLSTSLSRVVEKRMRFLSSSFGIFCTAFHKFN